MSFFSELGRRNVIRVGIAYAVVGWILAQVAEFAFENFGAPDWVLKSFVVVLLLGLPIALFFAWAFELTPQGVKREKDVDRTESITRHTGRKLDYFVVGALALALAYFIWERQAGVRTAEPLPANITADRVTAEPVADDTAAARSIAVLPFVNMSSDQEQEWFSDGLTEEILNALARTPDLLVASRTSSFKYKGSDEGIQTIADELGVAHVLEGSVRSGRDQLRVTAQLIRASDGFHLWSQTYDRDPDDVITIQEEIAIEIATALETAMDPEALARMLSAGTDSVPAFNAYLQGLAAGASTVSTGDAYSFLEARDGFERAIDLDPQFSLAYWELANFWQVQLQSNNIVSGLVDMSRADMVVRLHDAIEKAIEHEDDPVDRLRFRAFQVASELKYPLALRLNTEYLAERPNDQDAQTRQIDLLVAMSRDEELQEAILEFQQRDGHDTIVNVNSLTYILTSDDKSLIREFAQGALRRVGDSAFVQYQAHRALLWAGDIDGATALLPLLASSDLPDESRKLVALRQTCAENKVANAMRIFEELKEGYADDVSIMWISNRIIGREEEARQIMMTLDEDGDLETLSDYLSYAYFDAHAYPNLMAMLRSQGIEPRAPKEIPYRCGA